MFWNLFKKKTIEKVIYKDVEPREGWFVYEAGQNPLHCLWYCCLCSFELKDSEGHNVCVSVDECDTFSQAIDKANKLAEQKEL